jgi:hypothetical protein
VGKPYANQKVEPHTGYQINLRSGATGKKISTLLENILIIVAFKQTIKKMFKYLAVHIEGIKHPLCA